ncbi:aspartate--tRNA ligase, mitochondrial-like isoform X2 [Limulus polyphemus]|uniref:Aspartate--tRNA ligase, mitochondrial-like isoform X2 n=1 Tax=Limulus polyphemus TaxID=6850 RepID=A0ABM1SXA8_LIMPO|nr:aspartate--tRNA ligase, mitochondrial-like isoform X2 [Limulus polyphemus]
MKCDVNSFTWRTHTCGELRSEHVGQQVTLCGWVQFHRMGKFITLRDGYGVTQLIIPEKSPVGYLMKNLSLESVLKVEGTVVQRPLEEQNKKMATGEIEVEVVTADVLGKSKPNLPFNIRDFQKVKESLRLMYRYLDLRTSNLQKNLRLRSNVTMKMREFLCKHHGFVDIETPTLFRRTPGGAQEFVVPTHSPGKFYSLTQSPQQFKQLLMVGALDRYFQIAHCYRDEGAKADRQPEFTQVDIEMSFTSADRIKSLVEGLLQYSWPKEASNLSTPFPKLTYKEAMEMYGTDKPDTRFDMKIIDVTDIFKNQNIEIFDKVLMNKENSSIKAIVIPKGALHINKSLLEKFEEIGKCLYSLEGLVNIFVKEDLNWKSILCKHVSLELQQKLKKNLELQPHTLVLISAGETRNVLQLLGKLRVECAAYLQSKGLNIWNPKDFNFLWVVDFPLFLPSDEGGLEPAHHPFTAPQEQDTHLVYSNPAAVRSQHYDLVLNGQEIAGGSIRIHSSELQKYVLTDILKEDLTELQHLIEALESGCPPHGGIAIGLDRLMCILSGASSIRDVIAFPKSLDGKDLMSGAPAKISDELKKFYFIQTPPSN